jgi:DNA polymerase-3 subunit alpha
VGFIPLHVHSQYSILDSTLSIDSIASKAKEFDLSHVALTDFCNMYGAVDFYKAVKSKGVKPILGMEIMVAPSSLTEKKRLSGHAAGYPIVLLAKNQAGYKNLCKLTSIAFVDGFYYFPRIDMDLLKDCSEGLICLSGPFYSKIGSFAAVLDKENVLSATDEFLSIFGENFCLEVSRHKMSDELMEKYGVTSESWLNQKFQDVFQKQENIISIFKEVGKEKGIRVVATNDTRYLDREDYRAHEVLMNISSGEAVEIWQRDSYGNPVQLVLNPKRQTAYSYELYFKSPDEMNDLFHDYTEALTNTVDVAKSIDFELDFSKRFYPVFVPPELEGKEFSDAERQSSAENYLRELAQKGIENRYTEAVLAKVAEKYPGKDPSQVVLDRLNYELDIIISKGMGDYLLIVHDFIAWAKRNGIPMGPGRGSGAGSIILYLIGITDIEPLRFHLFFERFINPERISYPDIDVDICMERRSEVIDYTLSRYGRDKVAQIITFGTMKAKMAVRDVGRVLSIPLAKVNAIAKLIPEDLGITIARALEVDPDLKKQYLEDEETKRLLDLAQKVEGSIRNTGIHAAGLIVSGEPLTNHIPICVAKDSDVLVTQYSMKPVEQVGMLKIDFLGLKTLSCIQKCVDAIKDHKGVEIDWVNLPLDDSNTFALLNQGKTEGVFQLESSGMQDLARNLQIDKFEEIIAVGALYRPGPMEMIPSFIQRKHGREEILYDHEWLKDILQETYGIMVYQEQVMQIASKLAGYSLGEGDVLRRAMGKKDKEEMSRQGDKFKKGAEVKGIDATVAMSIFDKIEKFASYGFNKSHAAAYGYLSYCTAYMKANYPGEWMAALMTCDMSDLSKVTKHIQEGRSMSIEILPPDINESEATFVATAKGIRFALVAIKGIGRGVVDVIVEERKKNGKFASLYDFLDRVEISQVGKKTIENLIESGCFDFTSWKRKELLVFLEEEFAKAIKKKQEMQKGIMDLFGSTSEKIEPKPPKVTEETLSFLDILRKEKELLGFYVTGHPLEQYMEKIKTLGCVSLSDFSDLSDKSVVKCAFILEDIQVRISQKSQKKFAITKISDGGQQFEMPIWPDLYESKAKVLDDNALLIAVVALDKKEEPMKLSCKWIDDLTSEDEKLGSEFEAAFQDAKKYALKTEKREAKMEKEEKKPVKLMVDIEKVTLAKVLELKRILTSSPGGQAIEIVFQSSGKDHSTLSIDAGRGVNLTPETEAKIRTLSFVSDLKLIELK